MLIASIAFAFTVWGIFQVINGIIENSKDNEYWESQDYLSKEQQRRKELGYE